MYKEKKLFTIMIITIALFLICGSGQVQSQQAKYPSREIDLIIPWKPGASTDLSMRVMTSFLSKRWGVPINVINKPGGNRIPACLEVYNSRPDGYTLLADNNPSSSMLPIVVKNLPFKVMDRTFIAIAAKAALVFIVPKGSPFKSLKDLEVEAKKDPQNFTWTSLGGASAQDFVARQFFRTIGIDVFKTRPVTGISGTDAVTLTAAGNVKMGLGTTSGAIPAVTAGTAIPLAITSKQRFPEAPYLDVPTTEELGYATVNHVYWIGFSGPPKQPSEIAEIWNKALPEILNNPEVISKLRKVGALTFYHNARETVEFVSREMKEVEELWRLK